MPKSKSAMMKRLYHHRKKNGLVQFKVWVTPEHHKQLADLWMTQTKTNK